MSDSEKKMKLQMLNDGDWWLFSTATKGFLYFWINLMASTFNSDESLSSTDDLTHHNKQSKLQKRESETKSELNN